MTKPITIYTFDGTASAGASVVSNPITNAGGGYPAELAARLVAADPQVWNWFPVDYVPNRALPPDFRPVSRNVADAYNGGTVASNSAVTDNLGSAAGRAIPSVKAAILATPGKIVLSGLSQGTIAVGYFLNEFRYGQLQSRLGDLIAVVNFGDAFRPQGWTIPLHGATNPGGTGTLLLPWVQTYGNSTGLHRPTVAPTLAPDLYWSFSNVGDAASSAAASAQPLLSRIAQRLMYGTPQSLNNVVLFYDRQGVPNGPDITGLLGTNFGLPGVVGVLTMLATTAVSLSQIDTWLKIGEKVANSPQGQSLLRLLVTEITNWRGSGSRPQLFQLLSVISQWWPFGVGGGPAAQDNALNPHARYSRPFAYTAMNYNAKGAVQLAFERLHSLGKVHYPHSAAVAGPANNKPFQLLTFGKPGEFFDPSPNSTRQAWPSLTALGQGQPFAQLSSNPPYPSQPGITLTADWGRRNVDPQQGGYGAQIAAALNPARVEWVPTSYSSAAFPSSVAVSAAVNRAVSLVLASPPSTQFFLAGHGVGALVASRVHDEFMNPRGRLYARRTSLKGVYCFGNPGRGAGQFRGAGTNPGGRGVAAGVASIRPLLASSSVLWEFANPVDPVAVSPTDAAGTLLGAAYNVVHQNCPDASSLYALISSQARTASTTVSISAAKDVVLSLYSSAPLAHNAYHTWVPNPRTAPTKSAVQVAIDNIKQIAAA